MEQVVLTVEALRCWQCKTPLAPNAPYCQRQMLTAVEVGGYWVGHLHRYERVILCPSCEEGALALERAEQHDAWWRRLWIGMVLGNIALLGIVPGIGIFPLCGAVLWRILWKWQAKKQEPRIALP